MPNPYEEMGLSPGASSEDIKKAYRQLSRKLHPDKMVKASDADKAAAEVKFTRVQAANDFLTDATQRGLFDAAEERKASSVKRKDEREGAMDDRRKAMKRRLDEQESAARRGGAQGSAPSNRKTEADLRRANVERRDAHGAQHSRRAADAAEHRDGHDRRSVSVKWQRKVHSFSVDDLAALFRPFGEVVSVSFEGAKGNAAKVVFETPEAAAAAAARSNTDSLRVVGVGVKNRAWETPVSSPFVAPPGLGSARDSESVENYNARRAAERDRLARQMADSSGGEDGSEAKISDETSRLRSPLSSAALAAMEAETFACLLGAPQ
jgi:curved DNA-binding protein CbpA